MDFELMERNLAEMIRQMDSSLETHCAGDKSEDPVDPFRKKMFEKKMRRSSVASDCGEDREENKQVGQMEKLRLSNYCRPVKEVQSRQLNCHTQNQVENIFNEVMDSLLEAKFTAIEHLQDLSRQQQRGYKKFYTSQTEGEYDQEKDQYLRNLRGKLSFIRQYLTQKDMHKIDHDRNTVKFMETYECETQGSVPNRSTHEESQSMKYWSQENNPSIGNTTNKNSKDKKMSQNKPQAGSRIAPKSVYESVLEERRERNKKKRSRVV